MNMISRGIRNAFRNVVRTSSIVVIVGLTIALSLAMLVAHQAVGQRIAQVKGSVGNTITIDPAGVRGFDGGGNPLTTDELAKVKILPHVTTLDETLNDRLDSSSTNLQSAVAAGKLGQRFARFSGGGGFGGNFNPADFTPPVTVIGTTNPENLNATQGGGTFKLTVGKTIDGTSSSNVALVGATLATKNNLTVGSTFTAYGQTITVAGIFSSGNTFSDNLLIMPLATIQQLSGQAGDITGAVATVDSISNLTSVSTAIKSQLGDVADVTAATDQVQQVVAPLESVQSISLYSLIGAVIAGAVIILMTMVMIVRERRREIGVLKAMGAPNLTVIGQFVSEAVTLTMLGAVIGVIGGFLAANPITQALVSNAATTTVTATTPGGGFGGGGRGAFFVTRGIGGAGQALGGLGRGIQSVSTTVGWDIILYGLGLALLIAIIGSAIAAYFITKVRPAEVMRAE